MKRHHAILLLAAWIAFATAATAAPPAPPPADDPIAQNVFPPELIMKHGGEIGLDAEQRTAIKDAVLQAQTRFLNAQWEAQEETTKLIHLLQARPVDEKAVLSQADRLMDLERLIKKTQLSLLVRLKNLLTPAQQTRLADLRRAGD
ncbi:MAG TPA: periplasmic heavy metal sensor [Thermoanaerobaculia bacterium]|nr:periplasmic heavy metal sensor [Thermoanaerobaculia bacterium]